MSRSPYGVGDKLQGTWVDELDLECMRGTSAILTEEKERSEPVDEGSSYIFSSKMPSLNHFPDRWPYPRCLSGKASFFLVLDKVRVLRSNSQVSAFRSLDGRNCTREGHLIQGYQLIGCPLRVWSAGPWDCLLRLKERQKAGLLVPWAEIDMWDRKTNE